MMGGRLIEDSACSGSPSGHGAEQAKGVFHLVPACDQPRGAQSRRHQASRTADPPEHQPDAERPGGMAEPIIAEWMHYHRPVQPDGLISPLAARQHLPEALGWQEVQATADLQAVQTVVDPATRNESRAYSPTGSGSARIEAGEKSPVTRRVSRRDRGSRGLQRPRPPECAQHDQQLGGASPLGGLMAPTTSQWHLMVVAIPTPLYAHRLGREPGPDSSRAGLRATLAGPVDGLEADACLTADGRLACCTTRG